MTINVEDIEKISKDIQKKFKVVGRLDDLKKAVAAKLCKKHILIEGTVGVGKTTIGKAIAQHFNQPFYRIDGDDRFTENKLVGFFDPPIVMQEGYNWKSFISGPIVRAMQEGGILFINELNRIPEGTLNVLLPAMDERQIILPKLGKVDAKEDFLIIATQNPAEYIGTTALPEALKDRFTWIKLDYQSKEEELGIVHEHVDSDDEDVLSKAVDITRRTRKHPDIRRGASIRGAIDIASLMSLQKSRMKNTWQETAIMSLVTKIELQDGVNRSPESVVSDIIQQLFHN